MNKKLRYPMEAFALAIVLFSAGMKMAMLVGIGLIFGDVLQAVLSDFTTEESARSVSLLGAVITCAALYYMCVGVGIEPTAADIAAFAFLGILLMKHHEDRLKAEEEIDYNKLLFNDSVAYGLYVVAALVREYLAGAKIFEIELSKLGFVSGAFGKPMFGLIFAGVCIAIINRILDAQSKDDAAILVCVPAIILAVPFVWDNVPEIVGTLVGIVMTGVIYLYFRNKFLYREAKSYITGIPVETAALGMIYMIFSLL